MVINHLQVLGLSAKYQSYYRGHELTHIEGIKQCKPMAMLGICDLSFNMSLFGLSSPRHLGGLGSIWKRSLGVGFIQTL